MNYKEIVSKTSHLNDGLYTEEDLHMVNSKLDENIVDLLQVPEYIKLDDKTEKLYNQFYSTLIPEQKKLFIQYLDSSNKMKEFEKCLAYYLGIQSGFNVQNLK